MASNKKKIDYKDKKKYLIRGSILLILGIILIILNFCL